jgi:transcriptional regulator GlxA family with amidase domain
MLDRICKQLPTYRRRGQRIRSDEISGVALPRVEGRHCSLNRMLDCSRILCLSAQASLASILSSGEGEVPDVDPRVERLIATMQAHLDERLTVLALAQDVRLSVAHLTRLFRADTGATPAAYLRRLRMQHARVLVERTSLSVAEVMAQVGVSDRSHFARNFRRVHGVSPRTLRIQLRMRDPRPGLVCNCG